MTDTPHSITEFRANIYGMIDRLLETGKPLLLRRNNRIVEVREQKSRRTFQKPAKKSKKINDLSKIKALDIMVEDPDWYISPKLHEWSGEIEPNLP